jgi:tRNA 2-thiouridine synthesizing protein A
MDETADTRDDFQTAALLEDLLRMRGSRCKECAASLCGHETLMSLVAGSKDSPRCLSCLSRLLGGGMEAVRDHLLGYIMSRPCRHAGWLWANREEGTEPSALPICLWPPAGVALKESRPAQTMIVSTDCSAPNPVPDAEWDAGNMGCGELVMALRIRLQDLKPGQVLKIRATDQGASEDLPAWCRLTGHTLVFFNHPEYWIQRKEN